MAIVPSGSTWGLGASLCTIASAGYRVPHHWVALLICLYWIYCKKMKAIRNTLYLSVTPHSSETDPRCSSPVDSGSSDADKQAKLNHEQSGEFLLSSSELSWHLASSTSWTEPNKLKFLCLCVSRCWCLLWCCADWRREEGSSCGLRRQQLWGIRRWGGRQKGHSSSRRSYCLRNSQRPRQQDSWPQKVLHSDIFYQTAEWRNPLCRPVHSTVIH